METVAAHDLTDTGGGAAGSCDCSVCVSNRSANLIQKSEVCDCCVTPGDIPFNLEEAHTLTCSQGCLDVISGSSGEGERSRDTACK